MRILLFTSGLLLVWATFFAFLDPLCGCSTRTPSHVGEMKSSLRDVAAAQERFFVDHARFSADAAGLDLRAIPGVEVSIVNADAQGWAARATHRSLTDRSYAGADCVAAYGTPPALPRTTLKRRTPTADGSPVCDMDGWRIRQSRFERWVWRISR